MQHFLQLQNAALLMVRVTGVEPARIAPPEPKSGAYANFAIPAYLIFVILFAIHYRLTLIPTA